jgi:hypothetical protein
VTALDTALSYAERGWYVFPIQPLGKHPYPLFKWRALSSNDPTQIRRWAADPRFANCNWALDCGKSGLIVIDVDVDVEKGKDGWPTLETLPILPDTLTIDTPRGGGHFVFVGVGPNTGPDSPNKLGQDIDTRGEGGYVLIPGSRTAQRARYNLRIDLPPAPAPQWVLDRLGEAPVKRADRVQAICELDLPENVDRAILYLKDVAPEAVEGQGGDQTTFKVAAHLRDLGLSEDRAVELLLEHWNETKARPPWSPEEIARKVRNAWFYARDRPGNATADALFPGEPIAKRNGSLRSAGDLRIANIKPREWILGYRYLPGFLTVTVAPGGVGKSLLTICEGLSIASGRKCTYDVVHKRCPVWLYNMEDPYDELERRVMAAMRHHRITETEAQEFYYTSGHDQPIRFVIEKDRQLHINEKAIQYVINEIKAHGIKLLILDPFVRIHGCDENDNTAIDLLMQVLTRIAKVTGCAISLVHHTRKSKSGSTRGDANEARGASALMSAARIAHTVYGMSEKEAKVFGVPAERAKWFVRLDDAKANLAPPMGEGRWFEKQSVFLTIDSTESTGTLAPAELDFVVEDKQEAFVQPILDCVMPDKPWTLYRLAEEIANFDEFNGMSRKAIETKIAEAFDKPRVRPGLIYRLEKIPGERGKPVLGIVCDLARKPRITDDETLLEA